jgi:hypothetical protein
MTAANNEAAPVTPGAPTPSGDRCEPTYHQKGKSMNTITSVNEFTNGPGRWLGQRGIFRHDQPCIEEVQRELQPGEMCFHTMVTAVSFDGGPVGELIRWIHGDEYGYEVRVDGLDEHGGVSDAAAFTIDSLDGLAKVARDLRYEWELITGVYADQGRVWSVW